MKVFISHQQQDGNVAKFVYDQFRQYGIEAYLDAFDNQLSSDSKALTEHLKGIMRKSTDILVVMSYNTAESWWVPFEIGMAANQDLPTVTYLQDNVSLPEYLDYWPCLRSINDIPKYIKAHGQVLQESILSRESINFSQNYGYENIQMFYNRLKAML